jgi:hypothetical protein
MDRFLPISFISPDLHPAAGSLDAFESHLEFAKHFGILSSALRPLGIASAWLPYRLHNLSYPLLRL